MNDLPLRHFVETKIFQRTAESAGLDDDSLLDLEEDLRENPRAGAVVPGTGGARTIRVALAGGGKRGGARVLYFYAEIRDTIYYLLAYSKNVQPTLTSDQKEMLGNMIQKLEES